MARIVLDPTVAAFGPTMLVAVATDAAIQTLKLLFSLLRPKT